jgi:hypothetical protein
MTGTIQEQLYNLVERQGSGYFVDCKGIIQHDLIEQIITTPWIYFGKARCMPCRLWHEIYFNMFGIIPSHCMNKCWKVNIVPTDVASLFKVYETMRVMQTHTKCGIDTRHGTFGLYLGVAYNETEEQGKESESAFQAALPELEVFLKKGCTEFENRLPSNVWQAGPKQKELEDEIKKYVDHSWPKDCIQPDWVKDKIKTNWTQVAYHAGDLTWKDSPYADRIKISREPVKY